MTYSFESWKNGVYQGGYQIIAGPPITFQQLDSNDNVILSRNATSDEILLYNNSISTQNFTTIANNLRTHLTQLETWITNNPTGAILTAGQTLWVAQTLAGLIRSLLGLVNTIGQAN